MKQNKKIAGVGVLKVVEVPLSCVKCISLNTETKTLGIHFLYN